MSDSEGPGPHRSTDGLPVRAPGRRTSLVVVGVLEPLTLLVLLVNLGTGHSQVLAQVIGPVHGCLYLLGILLAWSTSRSTIVRAVSVVPALGAILAWLITRRRWRLP